MERKRKAVAYKGGKCSICGYSSCMRALEFHHVKPADKTNNVCRIIEMYSWERVKEELDKCILVCANCHRELEDIVDGRNIIVDSEQNIDKNV